MYIKWVFFNLYRPDDWPDFPLASRCRDLEQDVATLKAQLVEKQAVQSENDRLKLQIDSVQAQNRIEQKKAGEDRSEITHSQTCKQKVGLLDFNGVLCC